MNTETINTQLYEKMFSIDYMPVTALISRS